MSLASTFMKSVSIEKQVYGYIYLLGCEVCSDRYSLGECEIRLNSQCVGMVLNAVIENIDRTRGMYDLMVRPADCPYGVVLINTEVRYTERRLSKDQLAQLARSGAASYELKNMLAYAVHSILHRYVIERSPVKDEFGRARQSWYTCLRTDDIRMIEQNSFDLDDLIGRFQSAFCPFSYPYPS